MILFCIQRKTVMNLDHSLFQIVEVKKNERKNINSGCVAYVRIANTIDHYTYATRQQEL